MADQAPQTTRPSQRVGGFHWTPRTIIAAILAVLVLIFALSNFEEVEVSLLFWDLHLRLVWALLLFALIGLVIGLLAPRLRSKPRR